MSVFIVHGFPVPAHHQRVNEMDSLVTTQSGVVEEVMRFQARYMRQLNGQMALNSMGLPTGYWDPSIIIAAAPAVDESPPDNAWISLVYDQGFPTVQHTAIPFWEKLPTEPLSAYSSFSCYLALEKGRNLHDLAFIMAENGQEAPSLTGITAYFDLYSWEMRAKAYDIFETASTERYKAVKSREVEDAHLTLGTVLRLKAAAYIDKNFDSLTGREVIELLKLSIALERISTGLSPTGPGKGTDERRVIDVKAIIHNITADQVVIGRNPGADDLMDKALSNPETAKLVQDLALKLQSDGDPEIRTIDITPADPKKDSDDVLDGKI